MRNTIKVLFTTPVLHHPPIGGPFLRIENSIKVLSHISDLYIYSRVSLDAIGGVNGLSFYKKYCKGFHFAPVTIQNNNYVRILKNAMNYFSWHIIKRNIFNQAQESKRDYRDLLRIADGIKADMIWLGYGNISYPLLKYLKEHSSYKVVVDTDSVWSRFVLRGLPYAKNDEEREKIEVDGKAKEEEEKWGTQLADVTTAVSEIDREYYWSLIRDKNNIRLFSNVIDLTDYEKKLINHEVKRPAVYLAGTFGKGSPMEEAALWMIDKVLPSVWVKFPNLHFYILGTGSKEVLEDIKDERISILGQVPSALPYLCNVDIAVVPLKFESGTRFKILEAGACGIPIVSTTLGAEGLKVKNGEHILIADTPSEFSESIICLLGNKEKAQALSLNCQKMIEQDYSLAAGRREAEKIITYLTKQSNGDQS